MSILKFKKNKHIKNIKLLNSKVFVFVLNIYSFFYQNKYNFLSEPPSIIKYDSNLIIYKPILSELMTVI